MYVLWDCPRLHGACESWYPWLLAAAAALPHLGLPKHRPACLRPLGLLPSRLSQGRDNVPVDMFLDHLYGMYFAVLAERMLACNDGYVEPGGRLPADTAAGECGRYPWADSFGPLPRLSPALALRVRPGMPPRWPGLDAAIAHKLVRWAGGLDW